MADISIADRERAFFDAHEEFDWLPEPSIRQVLRHLPPLSGDVLELCAGSGMFTRHMPREGLRYACLDISPVLLNKLQQELPDIDIVVDSAIQPTLPEASFDYVCVFAGLHHLPDVETTISSVHRMLRPGGSFVCFEPNERCWYRKPMKADKVRDKIGIWSEDEGFVDPDALRGALTTAGFTDIRDQYLTVRYLDEFLGSSVNRILARAIYAAGAISRARSWQAFFVMQASKRAE